MIVSVLKTTKLVFLILNVTPDQTPCSPASGPSHPDQVEHHAGEAGLEVRGPPSLRPGRFAQHSQDSHTHAAGRLPAARQRAHALRPVDDSSQLGTGGRSSCTTQPSQQKLEAHTAREDRAHWNCHPSAPKASDMLQRGTFTVCILIQNSN